MYEQLTELLALINDFVQATIVVFGIAVLLFNLRHIFRDRVTRAFNSLLLFVVIVYFTELLVTRATVPLSTEIWIRLEWIGIAMVPAALFHLADALLVTTGDVSKARRLFVRVWYLVGVAFFVLALFTDLLVSDLVPVEQAPHLSAGLLFPLFTLYYWSISIASIYLVWRARKRCVTYTTRKRMSVILATFLAAPLAVFPYLTISDNPNLEISIVFWLVLILGNLLVSIMFAFLTYYIAYFGATSPDRVVRVRLFKFMARVPLTATIVLLVYITVGRAETLLGLPVETALAIAIVGTILLTEWSLHAFKQPLERLFQLTDEPEVRRIQQLSERVLTTRDMRQFLESILAASCEVLRTPSAFITAITPEGASLEAVVGPLDISDDASPQREWQELALTAVDSNGKAVELEKSNGFILWRNYWIRPLYKGQEGELVGILGIKARADQPNLNEYEEPVFDHLAEQAASALEDRQLQLEVFAAVEGLLPQVTALQRRRSRATFGGTPALTAPIDDDTTLTRDPEFNGMVWDALSHYWGGPKLTESPLMRLQIVQDRLAEHGNNPTKALRHILTRAVEHQRPEGERSLTTTEWILYNILELKFIQGRKVRDVARRLAMSESDLYRKQRVAIENVARTISVMEETAVFDHNDDQMSEQDQQIQAIE
jgi:hypothetical protein